MTAPPDPPPLPPASAAAPHEPMGSVGSVEPVLVTLRFDATDPDELLAVLARYVVVSRSHPGCRNIDLVASITVPNRYLVVQKWDSTVDQRRHFDSDDMVSFARACAGLLRDAPEVDLYDGISMHDLA